MADNAAAQRPSTPADRDLIGRRDTAHLCSLPREGLVGEAFTCGCGRTYHLLWEQEVDETEEAPV